MTKQFTPEEATRTLPYVKGIVTDILGTAKELRGRTEESDDPENDEEVELLQQDLLGLMEELEKLGASFRDWDFEIGLVDFPARIDGEEVVLSWRSDEDAVEHYMPPKAGLDARKRIPNELLSEAERN